MKKREKERKRLFIPCHKKCFQKILKAHCTIIVETNFVIQCVRCLSIYNRELKWVYIFWWKKVTRNFLFKFSGAQYLDDCPLEKYIPIYLVVSGSVGLFYNIFGIIKSACCKKSPEQMQGEEEEGPAAKLGTCMSSLLSCFMSAWFIAGKFISSILHAQTIFVKNNIDNARICPMLLASRQPDLMLESWLVYSI